MVVKPRHKVITQKPGVQIESGISLVVDWTMLLSNLGAAVAQVASAVHGLGDGSGAIASFFSALPAVKAEMPVGERAWTLFCLSFAWAFGELTELNETIDSKSEAAVKRALNEAKKLISEGDQYIPVEFLEYPVSLPIYRLIRDEFIALKSEFRPGAGEHDDILRARFDSAFNRAVFEVWSKNREIFQPIEHTLLSPGRKASELDIQWLAYRRTLVYDFEVKAIFGQERTKISVSQMFLPLRAAWLEELGNKMQVRQSGEQPLKRIVQRVCELPTELQDWIFQGSSDDNIRLIGGGPGSGKSTTMRFLARTLAERDDCRPLLIPLQYIDISRELRDAIGDFLVNRSGSPFRQNPLARDAIENGPPLVVIFDGLDELARPGEGADEVAQLFITKLNQFIHNVQGHLRKPIRVLVTGRMPSFQFAKKYASATNNRSLEVFGFLPRKGFVDLIDSEEKIASTDQRPLWWRKYSSAVGVARGEPQAMSDKRLEGLTDEPLLCYLLVLSGYAVDDWEEAAENRNRIYKRLIDEVWKRGWGEGGRQGTAKHLTLDSFNKLMETIAFAAWRGGDTKVATEPGFQDAMAIMRTKDAWEEFKRDKGHDITNLVMNFYLKTSELDKRGFEFTHKSFGDYLTARAILTVALGLTELGIRRIEFAAEEWLKAVSYGRLTHDIVQFLRDEIRLLVANQGTDVVLGLKNYFENLANLAIAEGMPAHKSTDKNWRAVELLQSNGELLIWTVLNACARALASSDMNSAKVRIDWGSSQGLSLLLSRLNDRPLGDRELHVPGDLVGVGIRSTGGYLAQFSIRDCLSFVEAPKSDLFEAFLHEADLRYANLEGSKLSGAHLCSANVSKSNLKEVDFERSHLDGIDFRKADIRQCNFNGARVGGTSFSDAQLKRITFSIISLFELKIEYLNKVERILEHEDGILLATRISDIIQILSPNRPNIKALLPKIAEVVVDKRRRPSLRS